MRIAAELVGTLLEHSSWSIARVLEQCVALSVEQYGRECPIGPGSLRVTLEHVVEAAMFYTDVFEQTRYRRGDPFEYAPPERLAAASDAASLCGLWAVEGPRLRDAASAMTARVGASGLVYWPNVGRMVPAGASIGQALDHASYHRAQCANMLRQLGRPHQDVDALSWVIGVGLGERA